MEKTNFELIVENLFGAVTSDEPTYEEFHYANEGLEHDGYCPDEQ